MLHIAGRVGAFLPEPDAPRIPLTVLAYSLDPDTKEAVTATWEIEPGPPFYWSTIFRELTPGTQKSECPRRESNADYRFRRPV